LQLRNNDGFWSAAVPVYTNAQKLSYWGGYIMEGWCLLMVGLGMAHTLGLRAAMHLNLISFGLCTISFECIFWIAVAIAMHIMDCGDLSLDWNLC
jgi:hypothetical protein